jgi:hypothetical protein
MQRETSTSLFLLSLDITLEVSSKEEARKWAEQLAVKPVAECIVRKLRRLETPRPAPETNAAPTKPAISPKPDAPAGSTEAGSAMRDLFQDFIEKQKLVRLTIVKGKGVKFEIPCRIVGLDMPNEQVTVYHVDEKKVYTFRFAEIDDYKVYV